MVFKTKLESGEWHIIAPQRLDVYNTAQLWDELEILINQNNHPKMTLDLASLDYLDGGGIALILQFQRLCKNRSRQSALINVKAEHQKLLNIYGNLDAAGDSKKVELYTNIPVIVGQVTYGLLEKIYLQISFVGECIYEFCKWILNPLALRWKDTFRVMEHVGANAVFIIGLIGFLLGLILAFQSAIPMSQFGVELFVANLVGLSLVRELGPLITCVILAGRSGSSFAAEIGTMKVNEELDALTTMGLSPVRFLVLPRIIGMFLVTPFLTIYFIFLGLIGGSVVLLSMGYPLVAYINQVVNAVSLGDGIGGLAKSMVFSILVAGVGCYQGLITGSGAQAVGVSTTRAVVMGIILIAVTDGAFAVLFYILGI